SLECVLSPQVGEDGEHATIVLRRRRDPELCESSSDVRLDRLRAEPECATDALVRATLRHERKDLPFPGSELVDRIDAAASREQVVDDCAVDDALALCDASHGVEQLFDAPDSFLHQVANVLRFGLDKLER